MTKRARIVNYWQVMIFLLCLLFTLMPACQPWPWLLTVAWTDIDLKNSTFSFYLRIAAWPVGMIDSKFNHYSTIINLHKISIMMKLSKYLYKHKKYYKINCKNEPEKSLFLCSEWKWWSPMIIKIMCITSILMSIQK